MRGQKKRKQECNFAASNARVRVAVAPLSLFFSLAPLARLSHLNNNNNNNEKTTPQSKTASSSAADQHAYREFQGRHHATMANHNNINDDAGSEATDMTAASGAVLLSAAEAEAAATSRRCARRGRRTPREPPPWPSPVPAREASCRSSTPMLQQQLEEE